MVETRRRQPSEEPTLPYDFSAVLGDRTIASSSATNTARTAGAPALGKVGPTIDGTKVLVKWTGGVDGEDYLTSIRIVDSAGDPHELDGIIEVREQGFATTAVSLETVKQFLKVDGEDQDAEIELTIAAAQADLEATTGLKLIDQSFLVTVDSFSELDHLQVGPVTAIEEIAYDDAAGTEQLLAANVYELFGSGLDRGVRPAFGQSWPTVRPARAAVRAKLRVGYGPDVRSVPTNLRHALLALIRGKLEDRSVDIEPLIVNTRIWL